MDRSLNESLICAVKSGFCEDISKLLEAGANPCSLGVAGQTALGMAAAQGDAHALQLLLDACTTSGFENKHKHPKKNKREHLHESRPQAPANQGYYIMVHDGEIAPLAVTDVPSKTPEGMEALTWDEELQDMEENVLDDEWTSLYKWYARILERTGSLISTGGPVYTADTLDAFRRAPIHYAAEAGQTQAVKMLIEAGVQIDQWDLEVPTPLHLAASNNRRDIVEMLLKAGARPNRKMPDKTTALHIAATRGLTDIARCLLDAGALIDSSDGSERTPLLLAVIRGHLETVILLLERGARVNAEEIHGYTPLCEAVWRHNHKLVEVLLSKGARVTQSHRLLHYCVRAHLPCIAKQLLCHGSVANLRDDAGDTPLLLAARTAQDKFVDLLLDNGANANCRHGLTGSTALHEAVEGCLGQPDKFRAILKALRKHGASLDAKAVCGGDTPLYRALLINCDDVSEILIKEGADVNACDLQTCVVDNLTLASKRGNLTIIKLLVFAGFRLTTLYPTGVLPSNYSSYNWTHPNSASDWLLYASTRPLPLTSLCRIRIRQQCGQHLYKLDHLGLPRPIVNYLKLEDI